MDIRVRRDDSFEGWMPAAEMAGAGEWENVTSFVGFLAEPNEPMPGSVLAKALIQGNLCHLRAEFILGPQEAYPGDGWYFGLLGPLVPASYAGLDIGVARLKRNYKRRQRTDGICYFETLTEAGGDLVLRPAVADVNDDRRNGGGKLERAYPWTWEEGNSIAVAITYEVAPGA